MDRVEAIQILQAAIGVPRSGIYDAGLHGGLKLAIQMELLRVHNRSAYDSCVVEEELDSASSGLAIAYNVAALYSWFGAAYEVGHRIVDGLAGNCFVREFDRMSSRSAPYISALEASGPAGLIDAAQRIGSAASGTGVPGVPVPSSVFRAAQESWSLWKAGRSQAGNSPAEVAAEARAKAAADAAAVAAAKAAMAAAMAKLTEALRRAEILRQSAKIAAEMARAMGTAAAIAEAARAQADADAADAQVTTAKRRASGAKRVAERVAVVTGTKTGTGTKVLALVAGVAVVLAVVAFVQSRR